MNLRPFQKMGSNPTQHFLKTCGGTLVFLCVRCIWNLQEGRKRCEGVHPGFARVSLAGSKCRSSGQITQHTSCRDNSTMLWSTGEKASKSVNSESSPEASARQRSSSAGVRGAAWGGIARPDALGSPKGALKLTGARINKPHRSRFIGAVSPNQVIRTPTTRGGHHS